MTQTTRRAVFAAPLFLPAIAAAQQATSWPDRPVRVIVPWPPGGSTDVLARILSEQLTQRLGQQFIIENRPGAGGNIGMEAIAKAAPDGYTMGPATIANLSIAQFLYTRMPFNPETDLTVVSMHWELPNVCVVSAQHNPARTMQEFIAWARQQRNGVSYGSPGVGTTAHLSGSLFCNRHGIDGTHVPFRGAAQIIPAMLAGDLNFAIDNLPSYMPVIQEGRVRPFAVTSTERWPTLPNVPTMAEAGVADFTLTSWCAWAMPANVPRPIVARLNDTIRQIASDPGMQARFMQSGARIRWSTPEDASTHAASQRVFWREVVRISGARLD
jgi:tripartite-type tricarboxylate transporter receptor subunit TctC